MNSTCSPAIKSDDGVALTIVITSSWTWLSSTLSFSSVEVVSGSISPSFLQDDNVNAMNRNSIGEKFFISITVFYM